MRPVHIGGISQILRLGNTIYVTAVDTATPVANGSTGTTITVTNNNFLLVSHSVSSRE